MFTSGGRLTGAATSVAKSVHLLALLIGLTLKAAGVRIAITKHRLKQKLT